MDKHTHTQTVHPAAPQVWDRKPLHCTMIPGEAAWVAALNPGEQDSAALRPVTPPPGEPGMCVTQRICFTQYTWQVLQCQLGSRNLRPQAELVVSLQGRSVPACRPAASKFTASARSSGLCYCSTHQQ